MTVQELIYDSLRLVGVLHIGEGPSGDEHTECLRVANTMLDSWKNERLMAFHIARDVYGLTPPRESYTLGPGGDLDGERPVRIENAGIVIPDNPAQPYELPLAMPNKDQYAALRLKSLESTWPTAMYHEPAFPLAVLHFYPVPTTALQVALYAWRQLTAFSSLDQAVSFPPGYEEAIAYNLALRLAPRYREAMVSPLVLDTARNAKAGIKRVNLPKPVMSCDAALLEIGGGEWSGSGFLSGGRR